MWDARWCVFMLSIMCEPSCAMLWLATRGLGNHGITVKKNNRKTIGKLWERYRKTMENYRKTMGKPWVNCGKPISGSPSKQF